MRITALFVVIGLFAVGVTGLRTQAPESASILPALLAEVRGLRAAMEQMASAGPRVQLALGRLQLQEQRLNTLVMKLDATRSALSSLQRQMVQQQGQMLELENAEKEATDPNERRQAEHMIGMMKRELATASSEIQRLTAEESSLSSDIASEQARWNDFNQRLEELERALGRR
jgi:predicted  nucleic acid-binding Zn-ribbon protein